jgi:sugar lactone lactonase YvrE
MKAITTNVRRAGYWLTGAALMAATGARAQNLFVSNMSGGAIDKIAPSGVQTVFATGLNQPTGLAFDSTGDLFEADGGSGNIYEFINSGGTLSANPVVFASGFKDPQGLAFNSAGDLFVSQLNFNDGIIEITPGGTQSVFASNLSPLGLAFNSSGDLFASNGSGDVVTEITPGGTQSTFGGLGDNPGGLAFNSAGDLFASTPAGEVFEFTPAGVRSTFKTGLGTPEGLTFNSSGDLFVSVGKIYEFTPGGAETTFASGTPQASPGLAFQPVPEPTIWGLLVAGAAALACRRRLQS